MARRGGSSPAIPITTARRRLFELVEGVLSGRTPRVEVTHREHDEGVVLVRKGELAGLEAELERLRALTTPEPRPLRGIGTLTVPAEEVVERIRRHDAEEATRRRERLRTGR